MLFRSKEKFEFLDSVVGGKQKENFENLIKEEADRIDMINKQKANLKNINLIEKNIEGLYDWKTLFNNSRPLSAYTQLNNQKAKKASILYNVSSDYSKGIAETFKKKFEAAGGEVVSFDSYNSGDKDFSAQLTKIKNLNPDVLVLPDYYDTVGLITDQARSAGITAQFLGGDGWDSPKLFEIGGDSVEGAGV